ncbi:MAG: GHKL domain-containing protein [Magnetospirillum sp.]|nr:GHKL domain-containing protein [Magnetospirillum sp.]
MNVSSSLGHGPVKVRAARAVALFGVLLLAFVWLAIVVSLASEHRRVLASAGADTANLARAFDEHILRTITGLDQTLLYLRAEFQQNPDGFDLNRSVANSVILKRVSVQIARIGADGWLADSNVPGFKRMDLSDREHFSVHRHGGVDQLFVSKPVLGRASGKWSIQLTRRLDDRAGHFAGVLVISLDPNYLGEFYNAIDVGADGAIAVVGTDGVARVASHGNGDFLGQSLEGGLLRDAVLNRQSVTQETHGPYDSHERLVSVRPLASLPLSVLVGRSKADILAPFQSSVAWHLSIGGAVTLALGAALMVLYRMVRTQEAIAADLAVKKAELLASRHRLRRYVVDLERIAEVAAHDLQEPLRRVVAYAQLLSSHASSVLDDEGRGYMAHVVDGAQRMRKLVKDLQSFVAVDQIPGVDAVVSSSTAVTNALDRLGDTIHASNASIVVEPLPSVMVDEKALTEIFTQLLDNAIRYVAPGIRPMVRVSCRRDGDATVFSVADNGIGIESRDRVKLFEVFHRLNGLQAGAEGTGIGLAIVRRMVEHMGGRVWVHSNPGEGSVFSFSLPVAQAKTVEEKEVRAA